MQKQLPVTRTLTSDSKIPLGWIRLSKKKTLMFNSLEKDKDYQGTISSVIPKIIIDFEIEGDIWNLVSNGVKKELRNSDKFKNIIGKEVIFIIKSLDKEAKKINNIEITDVL
jgi:hypothetical protein